MRDAFGDINISWLGPRVMPASYSVFGLTTVLLVTNYVEGDADRAYLFWAGAFSLAPLVVHGYTFFRGATLARLRREILLGAFLQGAAIALLEFRPLASFAILMPITAFVLIGGIRQLAYGLIAVALGAALFGYGLDYSMADDAGFWSRAVALTAIVLNQAFTVVFVLLHPDKISETRAIVAREHVDHNTGLRTRSFLPEVLEKRSARILKSLTTPEFPDLPALQLSVVRLSGKALRTPEPDSATLIRTFAHALLAGIPKKAALVHLNAREFLVVLDLPERLSAAENAAQLAQLAASAAQDAHPDFNVHVGTAVFPFFPPRPEYFSWTDVLRLAEDAARISTVETETASIIIEPGVTEIQQDLTARILVDNDTESLIARGVLRRR